AGGWHPSVGGGETLEEREQGSTDTKVAMQVTAAFTKLSEADAERCVVAYEPIWAIGTGKNATPDDANDTIGVIRGRLRDELGAVADSMRILYGGSGRPG